MDGFELQSQMLNKCVSKHLNPRYYGLTLK